MCPFCKFLLDNKEITKQQTLSLGEPVIMRTAQISNLLQFVHAINLAKIRSQFQCPTFM